VEGLWEFYLAHGFWSWIAVGAILLATEVTTGSGYLLWPAACTVLVGLVSISGFSPGLPAELGLFAALTIASTLASKRFLKRATANEGPDVNDTLSPLIGAHGRVVGSVEADRGRVFVQGKEWEALLEGDGRLDDGAAVRVVGCADAVTLKVQRA
jgi:membrane protein implicated in regulation of membrane protease activity